MGTEGQYAHTFVALILEEATALPSGDTLDWKGYPAVPKQVLKSVQICITTLHPVWTPPPPTEIMAAIRLITNMTTGIYTVSETIKSRQDVSVTALRDVLDRYEYVWDEVHVRISVAWEKV